MIDYLQPANIAPSTIQTYFKFVNVINSKSMKLILKKKGGGVMKEQENQHFAQNAQSPFLKTIPGDNTALKVGMGMHETTRNSNLL